MSGENQDEDIVLELEDLPAPEGELTVEAPATDPKVETKTADQPKTVSPEEGLEDLRSKLQAEKEARQRAEREADERAREVHQARTEVQDSNIAMVSNAIELVKQSQDILKQRYREAAQAQDFDLMADIQIDIASKAADLKQLENGKAALEQAPKPQRIITDPVENVASRLTPRSADWVRNHPEFATDQRLMRKMIRAHEDAVDDGLVPDTDAYFSAVESRLGITRQADVDSPRQEAPRRQAAPPPAPVSREATGTNGRTVRTVRLTAAQREAAAISGLTETEYARNLLQIEREGTKH